MTERTTRAVVLAKRPAGRFDPSDVAIAEIPLAHLGAGQAIVRNHYMSLDPSTRGRMDPGEKQYTTNFEIGDPLDGWAIGEVIETASPDLPEGAIVRHRLGWREEALVDSSTARVVDTSVAPETAWLGALGQTGFTAYAGLVPIGSIAAGDVVLVTGAGGAVGSVAGQLARLLGAKRVIGSAGGAAKCAWLKEECGFDEVIDYRAVSDFSQALGEVAGEGIDLFFDNVGGTQLAAALHHMSIGGRISLCGAVSNFSGQDQPSLSVLIEAVLRRLTLRGFIVRDHEELRGQFEQSVIGWLASGELIDRNTVVEGIDQAGAGLAGLLSGANVGKALVRLGT